jgi:hypothetical protein
MSIFEEAAPVGTDDRAAASADPAGALRGVGRKEWQLNAISIGTYPASYTTLQRVILTVML